MSSHVISNIISEPAYYHREYKNDVSPKITDEKSENTWIHTCQRVAFTALPFFSLYKPLSFPLSLAMGALRTYTSISQLFESTKTGDMQTISFAMLQTAISVIALAGTIFAHPLGMLISTSYDLMLEIVHLIQNLHAGEYVKAMENCLNIINNALYLALFLHGGLEITIASFAMQILLGLYHSQDQFRQGQFIEGVGHLLMSMVRGNQLAGQVKPLQLNRSIESSIKRAEQQKTTKSTLCTGEERPEKYSPIAWATHLGQKDLVKKMMADGVDFKNEHVEGIGSLLDIALKNKHFHLAEFFINEGLTSFQTMDYFTEHACFEIWDFLEKQKLLNDCKNANWLASCMIGKGSLAGIRFLIEHGADCSSRVSLPSLNYNSELPGLVTIALTHGIHDPDFIKFLVERGAPINTHLGSLGSNNVVRANPLELAVNKALNGHVTWNPEKHDFEFSYHTEDYKAIADCLVKNKALWPEDFRHETLIYYLEQCYLKGHWDLIFTLSMLNSCLEYSFISHRYEAGRAGRPPIVGKSYCTPLQHAVFTGDTNLAKKLLEHGANPNNIGTWNQWIGKQLHCKLYSFNNLDFAIKVKNTEMIELLTKYGASSH